MDKSTLPCNKIIDNLKSEIIGEDYVFEGPFGPRKCCYLDQTASGKPLKSIEKFIMDNILPVYANTHTTTSYCASQMSQYRQEARNIVKESCGGSDDDVVIFCGSGATAAVHKLVHSIAETRDQSPIVIIGPFEHHSNILPWRSVAKEVIAISEDEHGLLDIKHLEKVLQKLENDGVFTNNVVIGAFSAASNITGALTDDIAVTVLMHKYGGFAVWDYSAAAPHVTIEMNPTTGDDELDKTCKKDALFFSGHKFTGGPQTTGILMAKSYVFLNKTPEGGGGGGTVLFVTKSGHEYSKEIFEKEEAGTPNIIGSIRLGLVFQLKNYIGTQLVVKREAYFVRKALDAWKTVPEIKILGCTTTLRVPIISLIIQHSSTGLYLHHDFVVAVLNDLFGIQCRGGCMCSGPYSQDLLGMDKNLVSQYEKVLLQPRKYETKDEPIFDMIFKPGYVRFSLPFHALEEDIDFMIDAVKFIAKSGYKLLPFYKFNSEFGTFRFTGAEYLNEVTRKSLHSFKLQSEENGLGDSGDPAVENPPNYKSCLSYANELVDAVDFIAPSQTVIEDDEKQFSEDLKPYRWFLLPSEAIKTLQNLKPVPTFPCPFSPKQNYVSGNKDWSRGSIPHQISSILQMDEDSHKFMTPEEVSDLFKRLRFEGNKGMNENVETSKASSHGSTTSSGFCDDVHYEPRCNLCKSANVKR